MLTLPTCPYNAYAYDAEFDALFAKKIVSERAFGVTGIGTGENFGVYGLLFLSSLIQLAGGKLPGEANQ